MNAMPETGTPVFSLSPTKTGKWDADSVPPAYSINQGLMIAALRLNAAISPWPGIYGTSDG